MVPQLKRAIDKLNLWDYKILLFQVIDICIKENDKSIIKK